MSAIFSLHYSHKYALMAKGKAPLEVATTKKVVFSLPMPSEALLEKVVVSQVPSGDGGGTAVDFDVELLNSVIPFAVGEHALADAAADNLAHYRVHTPVTGPLTATAGNTIAYLNTDYGTGYRNADGGYSSNQNVLYLLIHPKAAGGTTKWNVTIQARTANV